MPDAENGIEHIVFVVGTMAIDFPASWKKLSEIRCAHIKNVNLMMLEYAKKNRGKIVNEKTIVFDVVVSCIVLLAGLTVCSLYKMKMNGTKNT